MAYLLGHLSIKNVIESKYKRIANILEFYRDVIEELIVNTEFVNVVKNTFPEGSFITQLSQNNIFQEKGFINFHVDPPHHIISSENILGLQFCVLLTDFTKENGCTMFLKDKNSFPKENDEWSSENSIDYLTGKKGDVYYWSANIVHSEGVNKTNETRSCLILNVQTNKINDIGFTLGEDYPIVSFYDQYQKIRSIQNLLLESRKVMIQY